MEQIANKIINIQVTDSSLPVPGTPDTGALDVFGGVIDGLSSTPITTILLFALTVAIPMCLIAIIFARLRHNKNSKTAKFSGVLSKITIGLTPVAVALAVIAAPLVNTLAAIEPLNNSAINITIDKAKSLSATGATTVLLNKDATSHVDIYTSVDNNFNNNLGTNLMISANNTNDSSNSVDLSTTNNLIYTTGPVETGDTTDFNLTVDITKDLPVGEYTGQINFYGDFVQKSIEVTFWCQADAGASRLINNNELLSYDDYIGITKTILIGEDYTMLSPNDLGMFGYMCNKSVADYWDGDLGWVNLDYPNMNGSDSSYPYLDKIDKPVGTFTLYWPWEYMFAVPGSQAVAKDNADLPVSPLLPGYGQDDAPSPDPSEPWYYCYVDMLAYDSFNGDNCDQYVNDMDAWIASNLTPWFEKYGDYYKWKDENSQDYWDDYYSWSDAWGYWANNNYDNNDPWPLFDGMNLVWSTNPRISN